MARARNIKPGFFENEDLAECSIPARLTFIALWTLADREGYLEDRPKKVKKYAFASDQVDVEPLLQELAKWRLIRRYTVDGIGYIHVIEFLKHQHPHHKEAASIIPKPGTSPGLFDSLPPESLGQAPGQTRASPADVLNPDILNPDLKPYSASAGKEGGQTGDTQKEPKKKETAARGTRLAKDWTPTYSDIQAAIEIQPTWTSAYAEQVAAEFRDYWIAVPGARGLKLDWPATWRNWCRKAGPARGPGMAGQQQRKPNGPNGGTRDDRRKDTLDRLAGRDTDPAATIAG